jgi:hypothetical protein
MMHLRGPSFELQKSAPTITKKIAKEKNRISTGKNSEFFFLKQTVRLFLEPILG